MCASIREFLVLASYEEALAKIRFTIIRAVILRVFFFALSKKLRITLLTNIDPVMGILLQTFEASDDEKKSVNSLQDQHQNACISNYPSVRTQHLHESIRLLQERATQVSAPRHGSRSRINRLNRENRHDTQSVLRTHFSLLGPTNTDTRRIHPGSLDQNRDQNEVIQLVGGRGEIKIHFCMNFRKNKILKENFKNSEESFSEDDDDDVWDDLELYEGMGLVTLSHSSRSYIMHKVEHPIRRFLLMEQLREIRSLLRSHVEILQDQRRREYHARRIFENRELGRLGVPQVIRQAFWQSFRQVFMSPTPLNNVNGLSTHLDVINDVNTADFSINNSASGLQGVHNFYNRSFVMIDRGRRRRRRISSVNSELEENTIDFGDDYRIQPSHQTERTTNDSSGMSIPRTFHEFSAPRQNGRINIPNSIETNVVNQQQTFLAPPPDFRRWPAVSSASNDGSTLRRIEIASRRHRPENNQLVQPSRSDQRLMFSLTFNNIQLALLVENSNTNESVEQTFTPDHDLNINQTGNQQRITAFNSNPQLHIVELFRRWQSRRQLTNETSQIQNNTNQEVLGLSEPMVPTTSTDVVDESSKPEIRVESLNQEINSE
ncbi:hypothetical protein HK096_007425 [Nowakowskiella sp. JEL0078]|nr:hypothetical protein HK096_007425 [Nowakowskiella sp. JEL0078]